MKVQKGYSLYGYIPYSDTMDIVACSGRHDKDNLKYRAAYYGLVEKADEKAGCRIAAHCPNGQPAYTKKFVKHWLIAEKSIDVT